MAEHKDCLGYEYDTYRGLTQGRPHHQARVPQLEKLEKEYVGISFVQDWWFRKEILVVCKISKVYLSGQVFREVNVLF